MKKIHLVIFLLMFYVSAGQDLTLITGGSITIPKDSYVFVGGDFTNTAGTVTLHSDSDEFSSLLVNGTASGYITYNRYVNIVGTGEWDLIGAPVSGLPFSTFIQNANIATNGNFYAVGSYDNTTDTWTNATATTTGNLQLGQGYQMATSAIVTNSHSDASVYVTPGTNQLGFRSSSWNLDDSVKTNLHNLDGTISISGVTYAVTGLKSAGSLIYYYVTPNPRDNGLQTNGNKSLTTNYNTITGATLNFTGAIANGDKSITIKNSDAANSGAGRRWNLIANPFASYLNGNSNADGTNNFLTVNTVAIDDNFEAIYGWKADGTGYAIYNNISAPMHIAPGQGFFVAAAGSGEDQTISFTKAMQTVTGVDDFVAAKSAASYELVLDMYSDAIKVDDTKFYFKEGLTLGLDPGYDAGAFNQSSGLSSRLVEQDNGIGMGINAMPTDAMSNVIVPLTINQQAGIALKIQIANSTIPEDINVYLEDSIENTFTLLTNKDFKLLAQTPLSGVGRFFLHYTTSTLSTETVVSTTSLLTAYIGKGNTYITVEGLQQFLQPANLTLYNVLGMKVLTRKIQNPSKKEMLSTVGMRTGVYILKVKAENIVFTKKLVIE